MDGWMDGDDWTIYEYTQSDIKVPVDFEIRFEWLLCLPYKQGQPFYSREM